MKILALLILSVPAFAQYPQPGGGGGGGGGTGASNPSCTFSSSATSCAIDVSSLAVASANYTQILTQCFTGASTTQTPVTITTYGYTTSGGNVATVTPHFSSAAAAGYCVANGTGTGAAGSPGATGAAGSTGAAGASYSGTSTTNFTTTLGSQTVTISPTGLAYVVGASRIQMCWTVTPTDCVQGNVTAYNSSTGVTTFLVDLILGTPGTWDTWNVSLIGNPGTAGTNGVTGATGGTGATGATGNTGPTGSGGGGGGGTPPGGSTLGTSGTQAVTCANYPNETTHTFTIPSMTGNITLTFATSGNCSPNETIIFIATEGGTNYSLTNPTGLAALPSLAGVTSSTVYWSCTLNNAGTNAVCGTIQSSAGPDIPGYVTYSTLNGTWACGLGRIGFTAHVLDLTSVSLGAVISAGGGGLYSTVFCNGTNWVVGDGPTGGGGGGSGTVQNKSSNYTFQSTDNLSQVDFNGSNLTASLPASLPTMPWKVWIQNNNSTNLIVTAAGSNTINGAGLPGGNITLLQYQVTSCVSDTVTGGNYQCDPPVIAGTNISVTTASNGVSVNVVSAPAISAANVTAATLPPAGLAAGTVTTLTDASSVTWNTSSVIYPQAFLQLTTAVGSTRTLNVSNLVVGGRYIVTFEQAATGGQGVTLGSGCTWYISGNGAGVITLSTGNLAIDKLRFDFDGTNCNGDLYLNYTSSGPPLAPPTFSPVSGTNNPGTVTMSPPGGATNCYNFGSAPGHGTPGTCGGSWTTGTTYSVTANGTLYAYATESAHTDSSNASATYTVTGSPSYVNSCSGGWSRGSTTYTSNCSGTSPAQTLNVTSGQFLYVTISSKSACSDITGIVGNGTDTFTQAGSTAPGTYLCSQQWYKFNASASTDYVYVISSSTGAAGLITATMAQFNPGPLTTLDTTCGNYSTSSSIQCSSAMTAAGGVELLIGGFGDYADPGATENGTGGITVPSPGGYAHGGGGSTAFGYQVLNSASGTYNPGFSNTSSNAAAMSGVLFK